MKDNSRLFGQPHITPGDSVTDAHHDDRDVSEVLTI